MTTGSREINICNRTGTSTTNREIEVCSKRNAEVPREIKICIRDNQIDCSNPPELTLTGADELDSTSDYEQYTASGGVPPYSWSFAGGTISNTGLLTSITSCGGYSGNGAVGKVTVTDACGQTASIDVRLPGGHWVTVDSWINPYDRGGGTYSADLCPSISLYGISDNLKVMYVSGGVLTGGSYEPLDRSDDPCLEVPPAQFHPKWCYSSRDLCEHHYVSGLGNAEACYRSAKRYEWRC